MYQVGIVTMFGSKYGSRSTQLLNTDPNWIRIHNTGLYKWKLGTSLLFEFSPIPVRFLKVIPVIENIRTHSSTSLSEPPPFFGDFCAACNRINKAQIHNKLYFVSFADHIIWNNYLCTYKFYGPVHYVFHAGKFITRGVGWALELETSVGPLK